MYQYSFMYYHSSVICWLRIGIFIGIMMHTQFLEYYLYNNEQKN